MDAGQVLHLAGDEQINRFYRVEYSEREFAWVYRSFVELVEGDPPPQTGPSICPLEIHVVDVGQGDAIWIRCPEGTHQLLIDAGDTRYPGSAASFRSRLAALQGPDDPIEVVVATHPHADHIGSMEWVLRSYEVGVYVDSGFHNPTATVGRLERAIAERSVDRVSVAIGKPGIDFCPLDDVFAEVLRPQGYGSLHDANDASVVVRVVYGERSFLFVGDAEEPEEQQLLNDPVTRALLNCDLLKVGHHGSGTSTS